MSEKRKKMFKSCEGCGNSMLGIMSISDAHKRGAPRKICYTCSTAVQDNPSKRS